MEVTSLLTTMLDDDHTSIIEPMTTLPIASYFPRENSHLEMKKEKKNGDVMCVLEIDIYFTFFRTFAPIHDRHGGRNILTIP